MSQWNSAGTMEERVFSNWAYERVKELMTAVSVPCAGAEAVVRATSVEGDATVLFVRGKKRAGYELTIQFDYTCGGKEGKFTLKEVTPEVASGDDTAEWGFGFGCTDDMKKSLQGGPAFQPIAALLVQLHEELAAKV